MSKAESMTRLPKEDAAEKGMVNVQIDGAWVQVSKGTRLIEACRKVKAEVPHYCYHPKLSSPGNCRMCLVQMGMPPRPAPGQEPQYGEDGYQEIGWMPRPVIACANTVAENMGIRTSGQLVEDCRNGVMEFLLINHPLDCPICDQAGECRLQEYSVEHGRGTSRFYESKVKKPKNVELGPRVRLDDERCILCSRCIRFMDEVAEEPVLGFAQRGTHTILTCHPGKKLDSNYSLNTVDLCPVGALTNEDFRFQMRVWFLKETKSIDVNCGTGCNITIWTRGDEIYRITPRRNDKVNSDWMPDSHRLAFKKLQGEKRLTQHLIKEGDEHRLVSLKVALGRIAEALREDSSKVAIIASARMTNEELYLAKKIAAGLKVEQMACVPREGESDGILISADRNPNTAGAELVWGKNPYESLEIIKKGIKNGQITRLLILQEGLDELGLSIEELGKLEFLAVTGILTNSLSSFANVVIAGASFAEKSGSMVNVTGRLQKLNKALNSPGEAVDDLQVLANLTSLCDGGAALEAKAKVEDVFQEMAQEHSALKVLSFKNLGEEGELILERGVTIPLLLKEEKRRERGEIVA